MATWNHVVCWHRLWLYIIPRDRLSCRGSVLSHVIGKGGWKEGGRQAGREEWEREGGEEETRRGRREKYDWSFQEDEKQLSSSNLAAICSLVLTPSPPSQLSIFSSNKNCAGFWKQGFRKWLTVLLIWPISSKSLVSRYSLAALQAQWCVLRREGEIFPQGQICYRDRKSVV